MLSPSGIYYTFLDKKKNTQYLDDQSLELPFIFHDTKRSEIAGLLEA